MNAARYFTLRYWAHRYFATRPVALVRRIFKYPFVARFRDRDFAQFSRKYTFTAEHVVVFCAHSRRTRFFAVPHPVRVSSGKIFVPVRHYEFRVHSRKMYFVATKPSVYIVQSEKPFRAAARTTSFAERQGII